MKHARINLNTLKSVDGEYDMENGKMKAAVLKEFHKALVIEEMDIRK